MAIGDRPVSAALIAFAVWFVVSIPFGIFVGKFIAAGQSGDLSRYLANPKDDQR